MIENEILNKNDEDINFKHSNKPEDEKTLEEKNKNYETENLEMRRFGHSFTLCKF